MESNLRRLCRNQRRKLATKRAAAVAAAVDSNVTGGPVDRGVDVWPPCRRGCFDQPQLDTERTPAVVPEVAQAMTLQEMCRRANVRYPLADFSVPHYDCARTELLQPMPVHVALRLIDSLSPIVDNTFEVAKRWRARATVEGLLAKSSSEGWHVIIYVRGNEPPPSPPVVRPPRVLVLKVFERERVRYLMTVEPEGREHAAPPRLTMEGDLLDLAKWMHLHRKSPM